MFKENVTKFIKDVSAGISKHSPEILTGIGVAGMITATVLAVKATPKAIALIEDEKARRIGEATVEEVREWSEAGGIKITPIEYVKLTWKPYIPAVVTGAVSVACLIGATSVSTRRTATLAAAYKLSETALTEFKEKAVEVVGEKKVKEIKEQITKDKIEKNPVSKTEVIITEKGNTLCYDELSGRYFKSDKDKIVRAVNSINAEMINNMYVSLNEFYDELGLRRTTLGDELGWNLDRGIVKIDFSSQLADDGTPCLSIGYSVEPRYDYSKLY